MIKWMHGHEIKVILGAAKLIKKLITIRLPIQHIGSPSE